MKNKKHLFIMTLGMFAFSATAQNPIVQTMYTAPATMKTNQLGSQ